MCRAVKAEAANEPAFGLRVAGVGAFPTPRRPKILWAGVTDGATELQRLYAAIEARLLDLGCYRKEERGYTPHLTLGRVRASDDPAALAAVVQQFAKWQGGQTQLREVLVMSSQLKADGPEYTVLSRAKLLV